MFISIDKNMQNLETSTFKGYILIFWQQATYGLLTLQDFLVFFDGYTPQSRPTQFQFQSTINFTSSPERIQQWPSGNPYNHQKITFTHSSPFPVTFSYHCSMFYLFRLLFLVSFKLEFGKFLTFTTFPKCRKSNETVYESKSNSNVK